MWCWMCYRCSASGVAVHFHDIFFALGLIAGPSSPSFVCTGTEQYLLQAFLALNPDYDVLSGAARTRAAFP